MIMLGEKIIKKINNSQSVSSFGGQIALTLEISYEYHLLGQSKNVTIKIRTKSVF